MQAYRIADKPGSVRAPRAFVKALRREVRDPGLDVWWDPDVLTHAQHPRNQDSWDPSPTNPDRGCWVVWKKVKTLEQVGVHGQTIGLLRHKYVDVYKLDGLYDRPMHLGPWLFKAMNAGDMLKRGNADRNRLLDDANENAVMAAYKESDDFAKDFAKDRWIKRIFAKLADERGTPLMDRDDRLAVERAAMKRAERQWKRTVAQAKNLRLRGT